MATLDHVSGGRLIFGAGYGGSWDFAPLGELPPGPARTSMLDEALRPGDRLLDRRGRAPPGRTLHCGRCPDGAGAGSATTHTHLDGGVLARHGSVPAGGALGRHGAAAQGHLFQGLSPAELAACLAYVRSYRSQTSRSTWSPSTPSRIGAQRRRVPGGRCDLVARVDEPGQETLAEFRIRIRQGPPR